MPSPEHAYATVAIDWDRRTPSPVVWIDRDGKRRLNFTIRLATKEKILGDVPQKTSERLDPIQRQSKQTFVYKRMTEAVENYLSQIAGIPVKYAGAQGPGQDSHHIALHFSLDDPAFTSHMEALFQEMGNNVVEYHHGQNAEPIKSGRDDIPQDIKTFLKEINISAKRAESLALNELAAMEKQRRPG